MKLKPRKSQAIKVITDSAPEYVSLLKEFHIYDGGWLVWPEYLLKIKNNLNLDCYVLLYEDEQRINNCMAHFLFDKDELEQIKVREAQLTQEQKQVELNDMIECGIDYSNDFIENFSLSLDFTPEQQSVAREEFEHLPIDEQKYIVNKLRYLFLSVLSALHNYFSVMVCGEKLTSLVPKAIQGDDESLLKAVKIDRNLLTNHPYFKERFNKASLSGEKEFLQKLAVRQSTPNLLGRIRYPGLYIVFSMLEVMGWLDDFTHEEILDVCDAAGLDRWQNRIVDVNAVAKQIARYRRYQKTGGVSMH